MIDIKEVFPFEAIAPVIGGAVIWFGANYVVIGPEVIGPRLQEKYYAPMCVQLVDAGKAVQKKKERALVDRFENRLGQIEAGVHRQMQSGARGFFGLFGAQGNAFWNKYGDQLGGGVAAMTTAPLRAQIDQERSAFYGKLEEERAKAQSAVKYQTADRYCGCVIEDALNERFDLAAYSASLRFYTPPTIRNIETGAIFADAAACGAMPIVQG